MVVVTSVTGTMVVVCVVIVPPDVSVVVEVVRVVEVVLSITGTTIVSVVVDTETDRELSVDVLVMITVGE